MYLDTDFPPGVGRLAQFMRVASDFERDEIEAAVDGFIAMLDARDGDADMEDDDRAAAVMGKPAVDRDYADEPLPAPDGMAGDADDAEDEGHDEPDGDELDGSNAEDDYGANTPFMAGPGCEISDPGEPVGDEQDANGSEDDFMVHDENGPGCPVADPAEFAAIDQGEHEDPAETKLRLQHRDRIRSTRCTYVHVGRPPYGWKEYRLRAQPARRDGLPGYRSIKL